MSVSLLSAHGCKAPVNIICGGDVTPTVPVTASAQYSEFFSAEKACLDNSDGYRNGGETTHRVHECIIV